VALTTLDCSDNALTALDISENVKLKTLLCTANLLTVLDVSKNTSLEMLDCRNNPSLAKILLAEGQNIPELLYDEEVTKLVYPEPEKKLITIPDAKFKAYLLSLFDTDKDGEISDKEALAIKEIKCQQMGIASLEGIESFLNLELLNCSDNEFTSLDVTKNLKLRELINMRNTIQRIDVSKNVLLTRLLVIGNGLFEINVEANTELLDFNCSDNKLNTLDVSKNLKLERLYCQVNNLKTLDLRKNTAINTLNCRDNPILRSLFLESGHVIPSLFIDTPPTNVIYPVYVTVSDKAFFAYLLENFDADGDGKLTDLEVDEVKAIDCSNLGIASLEGIGQLKHLTSLTCSGNQLATLNVNSLTLLDTLICDNNSMTRLTVSQNAKLTYLDCSFNDLESVDINANKELKTLICNDNQLLGLTLSENKKLETLLCQNNNLWREMYVSNNLSLKTLNVTNNPQLNRINLRVGQVIETFLKDDRIVIRYVGEEELAVEIPDAKFRSYLLKEFDRNDDGEISRAEALFVKTIDVQDLGVESLSGIEFFLNLTTLRCAGNKLTSLPVDQLKALEILDCSANELTSIDVSALKNLKKLYCRTNRLTVLYVLHNSALEYLDCAVNQLTALNVRRNPLLKEVVCFNNAPGFTVYKAATQTSLKITSDDAIVETNDLGGVVVTDPIFEDYLFANFDRNGNGILEVSERDAITTIDCSDLGISSLDGITSLSNLVILNCGNNKLTSLNVSGLSKLQSIMCHDNRISSIDVSTCTALKLFYCPGNLFATLDFVANEALEGVDCRENPSLSTVNLSATFHTANMVQKDSHTTIVFH